MAPSPKNVNKKQQKENKIFPEIQFKVTAEVSYGDEIVVCGGCAALGNFIPKYGIRLTTTPTEYPVWTSPLVVVPPHEDISYKYVVYRAGQFFRWEGAEPTTDEEAKMGLSPPPAGLADLKRRISAALDPAQGPFGLSDALDLAPAKHGPAIKYRVRNRIGTDEGPAATPRPAGARGVAFDLTERTVSLEAGGAGGGAAAALGLGGGASPLPARTDARGGAGHHRMSSARRRRRGRGRLRHAQRPGRRGGGQLLPARGDRAGPRRARVGGALGPRQRAEPALGRARGARGHPPAARGLRGPLGRREGGAGAGPAAVRLCARVARSRPRREVLLRLLQGRAVAGVPQHAGRVRGRGRGLLGRAAPRRPLVRVHAGEPQVPRPHRGGVQRPRPGLGARLPPAPRAQLPQPLRGGQGGPVPAHALPVLGDLPHAALPRGPAARHARGRPDRVPRVRVQPALPHLLRAAAGPHARAGPHGADRGPLQRPAGPRHLRPRRRGPGGVRGHPAGRGGGGGRGGGPAGARGREVRLPRPRQGGAPEGAAAEAGGVRPLPRAEPGRRREGAAPPGGPLGLGAAAGLQQQRGRGPAPRGRPPSQVPRAGGDPLREGGPGGHAPRPPRGPPRRRRRPGDHQRPRRAQPVPAGDGAHARAAAAGAGRRRRRRGRPGGGGGGPGRGGRRRPKPRARAGAERAEPVQLVHARAARRAAPEPLEGARDRAGPGERLVDVARAAPPPARARRRLGRRAQHRLLGLPGAERAEGRGEEDGPGGDLHRGPGPGLPRAGHGGRLQHPRRRRGDPSVQAGPAPADLPGLRRHAHLGRGQEGRRGVLRSENGGQAAGGDAGGAEAAVRGPAQRGVRGLGQGRRRGGRRRAGRRARPRPRRRARTVLQVAAQGRTARAGQRQQGRAAAGGGRRRRRRRRRGAVPGGGGRRGGVGDAVPRGGPELAAHHAHDHGDLRGPHERHVRGGEGLRAHLAVPGRRPGVRLHAEQGAGGPPQGSAEALRGGRAAGRRRGHERRLHRGAAGGAEQGRLPGARAGAAGRRGRARRGARCARGRRGGGASRSSRSWWGTTPRTSPPSPRSTSTGWACPRGRSSRPSAARWGRSPRRRDLT